MKQNSQRIAIHVFRGLCRERDIYEVTGRGLIYTVLTENGPIERLVPNYTLSLDAIRLAIVELDSEQLAGYKQALNVICGGYINAIDATAAERAEALLCAVGKWDESK